jgi:hypothetical protein
MSFAWACGPPIEMKIIKCCHLMMRRGRKIARVAMARRLAFRLYRMWDRGWKYEQLKSSVRRVENSPLILYTPGVGLVAEIAELTASCDPSCGSREDSVFAPIRRITSSLRRGSVDRQVLPVRPTHACSGIGPCAVDAPVSGLAGGISSRQRDKRVHPTQGH